MFLELLFKTNSNTKSNLVLKDHSKSHILPVSAKPAIPRSMSVSNFCVSSTLPNSMVQKPSDTMVISDTSDTMVISDTSDTMVTSDTSDTMVTSDTSDTMVQKPSFDSYLFMSSSFTYSASQRSLRKKRSVFRVILVRIFPAFGLNTENIEY